MIGIIAKHEALRLLRSAQTWIIAALLAALFGFLFLKQLESFIGVQTQLALQCEVSVMSTAIRRLLYGNQRLSAWGH